MMRKKNALKKTLVLYTMNEIQGVKAIFDKIPIHLFDQFFVSEEDKRRNKMYKQDFKRKNSNQLLRKN